MNTHPRSLRLRNLKLFFVLSFTAILSLQAQDLPRKPSGPVADFANILDTRTERKIDLLAQALWEQAQFGLVVATFENIGDEPIEGFASKLYEKWGIGTRGRDEGVLVVLSLDPRRVRIEVGYGAEGYINDAKAGRMLDQHAITHFRSNDYSTGLLMLSAALAGEVEREKQISLRDPGVRTVSTQYERNNVASPLHIILFGIVFLVMVSTPFGRSLLMAMLLSGLLGGRRGGFRTGGGFGGSFGGGGFGGGFGGGMSGGGGASRSF